MLTGEGRGQTKSWYQAGNSELKGCVTGRGTYLNSQTVTLPNCAVILVQKERKKKKQISKLAIQQLSIIFDFSYVICTRVIFAEHHI